LAVAEQRERKRRLDKQTPCEKKNRKTTNFHDLFQESLGGFAEYRVALWVVDETRSGDEDMACRLSSPTSEGTMRWWKGMGQVQSYHDSKATLAWSNGNAAREENAKGELTQA
jgi:hypothetical protein